MCNEGELHLARGRGVARWVVPCPASRHSPLPSPGSGPVVPCPCPKPRPADKAEHAKSIPASFATHQVTWLQSPLHSSVPAPTPAARSFPLGLWPPSNHPAMYGLQIPANELAGPRRGSIATVAGRLRTSDSQPSRSQPQLATRFTPEPPLGEAYHQVRTECAGGLPTLTCMRGSRAKPLPRPRQRRSPSQLARVSRPHRPLRMGPTHF